MQILCCRLELRGLRGCVDFGVLGLVRRRERLAKVELRRWLTWWN